MMATSADCASAGDGKADRARWPAAGPVTTGHSTTATGRNQGVCPCQSVFPTIELSSSRNSVLLKSAFLRCAAAAACHAERTPVSVIHAGAAHLPDRTVRGAQPNERGRSLSGSMFTADITARNCGSYPRRHSPEPP